MVALDAGVHLAAIARILEETQPKGLGRSVPLPHVLKSGPFAGLEINSASAATNAAHITRHVIDTYLITHPHLDHISGFVINTAGLPGARPKKLAGLPSTISAFKTHIFNNVIWPNLSDENNGAGLVTYLRLVEGGSPALGDGDGRGYMEISDGLTVRIFGVSHGHCIERHVHRGSSASSRIGSIDVPGLLAQRVVSGSTPASGPPSGSGFRTPSLSMGMGVGVGPPGYSPTGGHHQHPQVQERECVYDSSAYFVREPGSEREVLVFGDVEPDSISLSPRNHAIWQEAAPRVAAGNLAAIFIECSYDDSQTVDRLFGHLTPRFILEELAVLAAEVQAVRRRRASDGENDSSYRARASRSPSSCSPSSLTKSDPSKKRKRGPEEDEDRGRRANGRATARRSEESPVSPKSTRPGRAGSTVAIFDAPPPPPPPPRTTATETTTVPSKNGQEDPFKYDATSASPTLVSPLPPLHSSIAGALKGLKVVIIHVKERLDDDGGRGPPVGEQILHELLHHEDEARLGCDFVVSRPGQSFML